MKILKPKQIDANFRYDCECGYEHWLQQHEASTPKFIIACECGLSYKIQQVRGYKVLLVRQSSAVKPVKKDEKTRKILGILRSAGYNNSEVIDLIKSVTPDTPIDETVRLVIANLKGI